MSLLRYRLVLSIVATAALVTCAHAQDSSISLQSPNRQLVVHFATRASETGAGGKLVYSVEFRGKPVMDESGLSLELEGQPPLGAEVRITGSDAGHGIDRYTLTDAKVSSVQDAWNSASVHVVESGGAHRSMTVEARAYNDGIAFRYVLTP